MRDYVIVTDSSCDLPAKLVEELELQVVPLAFTLGETTYRNYPDNREMEPEAFYARLAAGEMATTTAVNVGQAMDILEPILQGGKDVLVLGFSSGLSATFHSFQMAAAELADRYRQRRAYAVDTLCASLGQGMLVAQAARLRQQGMDMDQVRSWVLDNRLHQCHWFTVNDLNFLKRGGRVSAATALVGTMLQIKPVMHMDDAGHLINMAKARGRKASLLELVDKVRELGTQPDQQTMYVSHSACLEDAQFVADEVKRRYGVKEVVINSIGPVIGAHTGPGCVALFFTGSKR
ncbi:MAG TPA: DegV family protein [Candidatus Enterenecus merdae]|nr:DegV family protein [Candidatus Enterenecus merdae]